MHYFTLVLIAAERRRDVFGEVSRLLAPFDERRPPTPATCFCVRLVGDTRTLQGAQLEAERLAVREAMEAGIVARRPTSHRDGTKTREECRIINKDRARLLVEIRKRAIVEWKLSVQGIERSVNRECCSCEGTGTYEVEYRERKWDEWTIGGRFSGAIRANTAPVAEILRGAVAAEVVVTPDGEWHERSQFLHLAGIGETAWKGRVASQHMGKAPPDPPGWPEALVAILERHEDALAVGCDLHV